MPEVSEKPNKIADWRTDPAITERFAVAHAAVSVRIYCHAGQKTPIYDAGKTIAVGPHGALMTVAAPVVADELVLLIHPKSGREMVCRVNTVEASGSGLYQVVLEFSEEAPDFWGVELFTPAAQPEKAMLHEEPAVPAAHPVKPVIPQAPAPAPLPLAAATPAVRGPSEPKSPPMPAESAAGHKAVVAEVATSSNGSEDPSGEASPVENNGRWRTPRLHLETRVQVCFAGEKKAVDCTTINIGATGALLQLSQKVSMGQTLLLKNPISREEIHCQVRYVKELSPQAIQVGVEFVKEAKKFWGITFPPENWDPSERKRPSKRS